MLLTRVWKPDLLSENVSLDTDNISVGSVLLARCCGSLTLVRSTLPTEMLSVLNH